MSKLFPTPLRGLLCALLIAGTALAAGSGDAAAGGVRGSHLRPWNLLRWGVLAWLALSGAEGQVAVAPSLPAGAGLDLASSNPSAALVRQGLGNILAGINGTSGLVGTQPGVFPPMEELNRMLASANPMGRSPLASLPPPGPPGLPSPSAPEPVQGPLTATGAGLESSARAQPLPGYLLNKINRETYAEEFRAAARTLSITELTEAFYALETVGNELIAIASLVPNANVTSALRFAAFETVALGFSLATLASDEARVGAQEAMVKLQEKLDSTSTGGAPGTAGAAQGANGATQGASGAAPPEVAPLEPTDATDGWEPAFETAAAGNALVLPFDQASAPLFWGTYELLRTRPDAPRLTYRFAPDRFENRTLVTEGSGDRILQVADHRGSSELTLRARADQPHSGLSGTLRFQRCDGKVLVVDFTLLRAQGSGSAANVTLEVLVEQGGGRRAFLKVSGA